MNRDTILMPARVTGLALLALATLGASPSLSGGASAQPAPAPPAQNRQAPPAVPAVAQPQAPLPRPSVPPNAGTAGGRGAAQVGRNRRPSYASCNRASHARGLRGGARRRFLVRCKLGYDRSRAGQSQQTAPSRQP